MIPFPDFTRCLAPIICQKKRESNMMSTDHVKKNHPYLYQQRISISVPDSPKAMDHLYTNLDR